MIPAASSDAATPSAQQRARLAPAFAVLEQAVADRVFPGASFSVLYRGEVVAQAGMGRFTYEPEATPVGSETIYDLASLTKVVATTTMAMLLQERGQLDLEAPVASVLPEFAAMSSDSVRLRRITFRMLLAHSSGLPAYAPLFETSRTREDLLHAALSLPLEAEPGTRVAYSDIGFIILGAALERVAGEPLDQYCGREVFAPLGMRDTAFRPPAEWKPRIPPTEDDKAFRHRAVQGEVHDENASVLGGVAGHAGLFSSAHDVATFARCLLAGSAPLVARETLALFTRREGLPDDLPGGSTRALGWDTPGEHSQAGRYFSARCFGHLGFTGTSLWIDPERKLAIVLLSNRTWPTREQSGEAIKRVRPAFHDAVVEALS